MNGPIDHTYSPGAGHTGLCTKCNKVELHPYHQPAPAHETAVSTAETDPAAIDLEGLGSRYLVANYGGKLVIVNQLIAAVEALRERVAELEAEHWQSRAVGAEAALEASEAQVVELAGALEKAADDMEKTANWLSYQSGPFGATVVGIKYEAKDVRTALARLPANALERAKVKDEATGALRSYYTAEMMADTSPTRGRAAVLGEIGLFLGKLDALDREDRT